MASLAKCVPFSSWFSYSKERRVRVTLCDKRYGRCGVLAVALRIVAYLSIFAYVVVNNILWKAGYAQMETDGQSDVFHKLRGFFTTDFDPDDLENVPEQEINLYNSFWDAKDDIFKARQDFVFIATNLMITPKQTKGKCPDYPHESTSCNPNLTSKAKRNPNCTSQNFWGESPYIGNGRQTGRCVRFNPPKTKVNQAREAEYTCEYQGWCPPPSRLIPSETVPVFGQSRNFTVQIQNKVIFPSLGLSMTNNITQAKCFFDLSDARNRDNCRNFRVADMVNLTGHTFDQLALRGAVIRIDIIWDCFFGIYKPFGLNWTWNQYNQENPCLPKYKFYLVNSELPGRGLGQFPGRYHLKMFYTNDGTGLNPARTRALYKVYGLGKGSKKVGQVCCFGKPGAKGG